MGACPEEIVRRFIEKCDAAQARVLRRRVPWLQAVDLDVRQNVHAPLGFFFEEVDPGNLSGEQTFERNVRAPVLRVG